MTADKTRVLRLIKTARGQMDGILKMVEDDRYCVDICIQLMACEAILKKANTEVLKAHLTNCVLAGGVEDPQAKVDEISKILGQLM